MPHDVLLNGDTLVKNSPQPKCGLNVINSLYFIVLTICFAMWHS
ncbi:hypothetical protein WP3W18E06_13150 [Raoultella ornithinolytica]|nr:hypothetical protein WP3W18E06_13150 [Raoultella ornithinolytica]